MKARIRVPGKFIVTGEHAVLRGVPAVVYPLASRSLEIDFQEGQSDLEIEVPPAQSDLNSAIRKVLDRAQKISAHAGQLHGHLRLQSNIPVGAGLGASAALTSAVALLFQKLEWIGAGDLQDFARELENLFHGESSGVDVAAVLGGKPLIYARGSRIESFKTAWKPRFVLASSGHRGLTSECIQKVKEMWEQDLPNARQIDEAMRASSELAIRALSDTPDREKGEGLLCEALSIGRDCFRRWGLETPIMAQTSDRLLEAGCLAVKPTGSGAGGFILGLLPEGKPFPEIVNSIQVEE